MIQPQLIVQGSTLRDPYAIYRESMSNNIPLRSKRKAEQLKFANGGTIYAQSAATWTADQVIVVYFTGTQEEARFVPTEPEFDYWKALAINTANYGENKEFGEAREIQFVKFAGANLLAGQTIGA